MNRNELKNKVGINKLAIINIIGSNVLKMEVTFNV